MVNHSEDLLKFLYSKLGGSEKVMEEYKAYRIQSLVKTEATVGQLFDLAFEENWGPSLREMTLRELAAEVLRKGEEKPAPKKKKAKKNKAPRRPESNPEISRDHKKIRTAILAYLERLRKPARVAAIVEAVGRPSAQVQVLLSYLVKEGWVKKDSSQIYPVYSKTVNPGFKLTSQTKDVPIVNQVSRFVDKLFLEKDRKVVTMGEIHRACFRLPLSKKQISRAVRALVENGRLLNHSRGVYYLH